MELDATALSPKDAYALMIGLIVPRPIAWVSTCDEKSHVNLAPFSYFNGIASDPLMLSIAISNRRDGSDKDTLRLIKQTGVFCVNLVESPDLVAMNNTAAELAPDESEALRFGIATTPCVKIAGVRIASARASWECKLVDVHRYGRKQQVSLVVGEAVHVSVADSLVDAAGVPDPASIDPVARMGGVSYAMLGQRLAIPRP